MSPGFLSNSPLKHSAIMEQLDICGTCRTLLGKLADPHQRPALVDAVIPHDNLRQVPEVREAARQYAELLEAAARKVVATSLCQGYNPAAV